LEQSARPIFIGQVSTPGASRNCTSLCIWFAGRGDFVCGALSSEADTGSHEKSIRPDRATLNVRRN
jgi:hypothetical protein